VEEALNIYPARRVLLTAALGFMHLDWCRRRLSALAAWLDSWRCANVQRHPHQRWPVNLYDTGIAHSVVLASACEPTAWGAVQRAAGEC